MRISSLLISLATFQAVSSLATALPPAAVFYCDDMAWTGKPFALSLPGAQSGVKSWKISLDDESVPAKGDDTSVSLTCPKSGLYHLSVTAELESGKVEPVPVDYARLVLENHPESYFRFGDSPAIQDSTMDPSPALDPVVLPWGGHAARFDNQNSAISLSHVLPEPTDQFSVEFWLQPKDLKTRQEILSPASLNGRDIFIANGSLHFQVYGGHEYSAPFPATLQTGAWHHFALTYDRCQLFPYQNTARFYMDGILAGEYRLDVRDTGPVILPSAYVGSTWQGQNRLQGAIAELAVYDRLIRPDYVFAQSQRFAYPSDRLITVVPVVVQPFTVDAPRITQDMDIYLDPAAEADNGPTLNHAINEAQPGTRLKIINQATGKPGGTFNFSSIAPGGRWTAIQVMGKEDLEIDGGGALFNFKTDATQITVLKCTRVALRNFSVDLDQSKFRVGVYARILKLNEATGDVSFQFVRGCDLAPDRDVPDTISMWRWRPQDPKTFRLCPGPYFKTGEVFTAKPVRDPSDRSIMTTTLKPGQGKLLEQLAAFQKGTNLFLINNARFENKVVSLYNCEHIIFDRINFYACLGMVFLSSDLNHLQVSHCKIGLPPGVTVADRPLAAGADGYHFHETQGCILFEDNEIALTDDDPISIKDGVWRDVSAVSTNSLKTGKGFKTGDQIVIYGYDFSPLGGGTVVSSSDGIVTLDQPLPADLPAKFLAMNLAQHTYNWIIRNCYFHDYYGRLMLYTPHGIAEGNTIMGSYFHLGASCANFDSSGISSNVVVRNNLFIDTFADTGIWGSESQLPVFKNIVLANNSFIGRELRLNNTGDAWVVNNYFEIHPGTKEKDLMAVYCLRSQQATIENNCQAGNSLGSFQLDLGKNTTTTSISGNSYVELPQTPDDTQK